VARALALGRALPLDGAGAPTPLDVLAHHLTKHAVVVGMTGSGKSDRTGAAKVIVPGAAKLIAQGGPAGPPPLCPLCESAARSHYRPRTLPCAFAGGLFPAAFNAKARPGVRLAAGPTWAPCSS